MDLADTTAINHAHDKAGKCAKYIANPCYVTVVNIASGRDDSRRPGAVEHTSTYVSTHCI